MSTNLSDTRQPLYSERLGLALKLAADAFQYRSRKGTPAPYLTHLLSVTSLVMDYGGTEDQMIAAALHDLLEDIKPHKILQACAGLLDPHHYAGDRLNPFYPERHAYTPADSLQTHQMLRTLFGPEAVRIIVALSDSTAPGKKDDWAERKRAYVKRLLDEDATVKLVCCSDKIHNMRSIVLDFSRVGHAVFERFGKTTVHDHHWYYMKVTSALSHRFEHPIVTELQDVYGDLQYVLEVHCHSDFTKSAGWEEK